MGFEFSLLSYNSTLPFCVISDIVVTPPPPQNSLPFNIRLYYVSSTITITNAS